MHDARHDATTSAVATSSRSPRRTDLALDHAATEPLRADDELQRHADEVGIGELHARARVTIVVEHLDARGAQLA